MSAAMAPNSGRGAPVVVNGRVIDLNDDMVDAGQILKKAGFLPPSEHLLVEISRPGTEAKGLHEQIVLDRPREFRAFRADRAWNFMVQEVAYAWGANRISVADLHDVTGVSQNRAFILERENEADEIIDTELDLDAPGVEDVRVGKRLVTVKYNHQPFELERRKYQTEELLAVFSVEAGYVLDVIAGNGELRELAAGQSIKVREGMEFVSHAPIGQSA